MEKGNSLHNLKSIQDLKAKHEKISQTHMRQLLSEKERNTKLTRTNDGIMFDYSHEKLDVEAVDLLIKLAEERQIANKFSQMFNGEKINKTEKRRVLHVALRKDEKDSLVLDDVDLVKEVHEVLKKVKTYSNEIRNKVKTGWTGKKLKNIISIRLQCN
jgi:glucose-6-phosphate isomerase